MKAITHTYWRGWRTVAIILSTVLVLVAAGLAGYYFASGGTQAGSLPAQIKSNLEFSPMVLSAEAKDITASEYKFSAAENNTQILTYVIRSSDGKAITVSQYTQPPQFDEIPEYKSKFLTSVAQQYDTVQTSNGVVYLGRMAKQENKQLAVMVEKGLLVFMNPESELEPSQWREVVEQMVLSK